MNSPDIRERLRRVLCAELGGEDGEIAFHTIELAWHRHGFSDVDRGATREILIVASLAAGLLEAKRIHDRPLSRRAKTAEAIALRLVPSTRIGD